MFAQELSFFIKNQEELVRKYAGKALVIKGEKLCGVYDTPLDAYIHIQHDNDLGRAMIQVCQPGLDAYTATIN